MQRLKSSCGFRFRNAVFPSSSSNELSKGNASRIISVKAAMLQNSGWMFTRVQLISKALMCSKQTLGLSGGSSYWYPRVWKAPPKTRRSAWPWSIVLIVEIPVYFYFWSRLDSGYSPRHSPFLSLLIQEDRTHMWEEELNCVPLNP